MARIECPNCGNALNTNEKDCKYCGTANEAYVASKTIFVNDISQGLAENRTESEEKTQKSGSIFVFIVLLCVCWPIAILYAITNFKK